MALVINDRVKETSTTTGTGVFSIGNAVTGFETFADGVGNSNTTYYCIAHQDQDEFEVGLGTLNGDSSTLTRTTVISSTNSCLLYTSPSPRDLSTSRMPSSA